MTGRGAVDVLTRAAFKETAQRLDEARQAAMADRPGEVQRLREHVPAALAERRQWLMWRYEVDVERPASLRKPLKMPYYANGRRRTGGIGSAADVAKLVSLEDALKVLADGSRFDGLGFTFLAGDGLIGVDVDGAIDADGRPSHLCQLVVEGCASYTELSPSGKGLHVIVLGETETFKSDRIGLEVYCGGRYFTVTGRRCDGPQWPQTPADVQPIEPAMLDYMRGLVNDAKAADQAGRDAARQLVERETAGSAAGVQGPAAPAAQQPEGRKSAGTPAAAPRRATAQPGAGRTDDFRAVNDAAMASLDQWVPVLFAKARKSGGRYWVTSKALGRDLEDNLTISPQGIVDQGVADMGDARQGRRTPIDLVMEWGGRVGIAADKPVDAMKWLAQQLGVTLSAPPQRRPQAGPKAPMAEPPIDADQGPAVDDDAGVAQDYGESAGDGDGDGDGSPADASGGGKGRKKWPAEMWALVHAMCERFALVYGSDTAWDRLELMLIRIPNMRLAFGKDAVNLWLSRPAPARQMVRPTDLVFEPGSEIKPPAINMYGGLDVDPMKCEPAEVQPMLDLLRHLCADTRIEGDPAPVETAMQWVLSWMALPLQRVGTKLATAVVMHGSQGTGKNLFWDSWRDLFGVYGITVGQTELEDKYNGWLSRKLAIIGDEVVSRQEMYHNKNRLKLIVTQQDKFPIRGMFMETRWESNHANVVFTSNEDKPLVLEDRDRRYMVIYTPLEADPELYRSVRDFLQADGLRKWLHYLQTLDLAGFHAHTKPPMTAAKESLIQANWRPSAQFGHEWLEGFLALPIRPCSAEQLYRAFRLWCDRTGARWPPEQRAFTGELGRWVRERVKRGADGPEGRQKLNYRQIGVVFSDTERRTVRCWVPDGCGPMNGEPDGSWMADCIRTFEDDLYRYRHPRRIGSGPAPSDGGDDQPAPNRYAKRRQAAGVEDGEDDDD